jgi:hypothetical protein
MRPDSSFTAEAEVKRSAEKESGQIHSLDFATGQGGAAGEMETLRARPEQAVGRDILDAKGYVAVDSSRGRCPSG